MKNKVVNKIVMDDEGAFSIKRSATFDRSAVFNEVDKSNMRFNTYSKKERAEFRNAPKYDWYPKTETVTNPFEKPLFFIEYYTSDNIEWNYKICQRNFIISEDEYNERVDVNDGTFDLTLWCGVEGHAYTLHEGVVNQNENSVDFTKKFLEYTVDALNEKVNNDALHNVTLANKWEHAK